MFQTNFSGHNKIWGSQKIWGGSAPPNFLCPPNFVGPRNFFIKTYNKNKNLAPIKCFVLPQKIRPSYGPGLT